MDQSIDARIATFHAKLFPSSTTMKVLASLKILLAETKKWKGLDGCRLPLQPFHRDRGRFKEILGFSMNIGMILIQPILLPSGKKILINQFPTIGNHSNVFKAQIWFLSKLMFGFDFFDHDDVLGSNAESSVIVITWFVGDYVSGGERNFGVLDPGSDSYGAFVDV